jgi:hypothetical protein
MFVIDHLKALLRRHDASHDPNAPKSFGRKFNATRGQYYVKTHVAFFMFVFSCLFFPRLILSISVDFAILNTFCMDRLGLKYLLWLAVL